MTIESHIVNGNNTFHVILSCVVLCKYCESVCASKVSSSSIFKTAELDFVVVVCLNTEKC